MTVIKRDKKDSTADLVTALDKLIPLLANQDEEEAVGCLKDAMTALRKAQPGTADHKSAIATIIDAFEGDHELNAYTIQAKSGEWSAAEELSIASNRVLSLAMRMR